jgi:hypothetical protein
LQNQLRNSQYESEALQSEFARLNHENRRLYAKIQDIGYNTVQLQSPTSAVTILEPDSNSHKQQSALDQIIHVAIEQKREEQCSDSPRSVYTSVEDLYEDETDEEMEQCETPRVAEQPQQTTSASLNDVLNGMILEYFLRWLRNFSDRK